MSYYPILSHLSHSYPYFMSLMIPYVFWIFFLSPSKSPGWIPATRADARARASSGPATIASIPCGTWWTCLGRVMMRCVARCLRSFGVNDRCLEGILLAWLAHGWNEFHKHMGISFWDIYGIWNDISWEYLWNNMGIITMVMNIYGILIWDIIFFGNMRMIFDGFR